jgi:hypothetical protein
VYWFNRSDEIALCRSLARSEDHIDVFWVGPDGSVRSNWWDSNANRAAWNQMFNVAPASVAQPGTLTSIARTPTHIDVFWTGPDGSVRSNWWDQNVNNGNWNQVFNVAPAGSASELSSAVVALARFPLHVDVFWVAPDGSVKSNWWDQNVNNGNWNQVFEVAPASSAIPGTLTAFARTPTHVDVFWVAPDGSIESNWWDQFANAGKWNEVFKVAPAANSGPGLVTAFARLPSHIDVFWVAPDGSVKSNWWDQNVNNGNWTQVFNVAPPGSAAQGPVSALARLPFHIDVFWVAPDGSVKSNWWDQNVNRAAWNQMFNIAPAASAQVGSPVTVLARANNHLDVFWVAPDGSVLNNWWDSNVNNGTWNQVFNVAPAGSAEPGTLTALARTPTHVDVFWTAPDGSMRTNWWDQSVNSGKWNQVFNVAPAGSAAHVP